VRTAPNNMNPKLNVCWVVLAAFSLAVRLPQDTLPSSFNMVTFFLRGFVPLLVVPKSVWVAYNLAAITGRRLAGRLRSGRALDEDNMID
jgi:hypothetical protein